MGVLARVMRFLIWVVLLLWTFALLRRVIAWMVHGWFGNSQHGNPHDESDQLKLTHRLVRDPVCGLYMPEEHAIALREGEQELHFCSVSCREKYRGTRKYAANG